MKEPTITTEAWQMNACDIAQAVREGKISCRQVITDHLELIEQINGKVNAITVILTEQALAAAEKTDRKIENGESVGPLAGVPVTVK